MVGAGIARRYAKALFEVAAEHNRVDEQEQELQQVVEVIQANEGLRRVLASNRVGLDQKKAVLDELFKGLSEHTRNLLRVVVDKQREAALPEILEAYIELADRQRGVVPVEVRSAVPLDDATLNDIAERLKSQGVPKARFSTRVEPELIGGLVLRIGDKLYDGSVRTRLRRLKQRLAQA